MITNKIADAVIAQTEIEFKKDRQRPIQTRNNEAFGFFVSTVFDAVAGFDGHTLPYSARLEKCTDKNECRQIILEIAK